MEAKLDMEEGEAGEQPDEQAAAVDADAQEQETEGGLTRQEIEDLRQQLQDAEEKAAENLDGWQRSLADFSNYKKRMEKEREFMRADVVGRVMLRYLEVVDDLERALENRPESGDDMAWVEGFELIHRKLKTLLANEGIVAIEAEGKPFDPTAHEAISQEPSDTHESGHVIQVVQAGYMLKDRVLRPARVRVAM